MLIIGGRYGSAATTEEKKPHRALFERYDSITKKEYDAACSRDIPVYILVEQNVHAEYQTYLRNKDNENIQYAHVDSVNVFRLIQDFLSKPRYNPVHTFERFSDIESWLREQWVGLFRELLQRMSSQKQIATLSAQVEALTAINATLQRYLEEVVSKVSPDEANELIKSERKRLGELEQLEALRRNDFFHLGLEGIRGKIKVEPFRDALLAAGSFAEFAKKLGQLSGDPGLEQHTLSFDFPRAIRDINEARAVLRKEPFPVPGEEFHLPGVEAEPTKVFRRAAYRASAES